MEAAALGYPALAVSLEVEQQYHRSYSNDIDFSTAAYFTALFTRLILEKQFPPDVDLLKVDIPSSATPDTPWQVTRLARQRYYEPVRPQRSSFDQPATVGYKEAAILDQEDENSDVYVLRKKRWVSVTPISLDMTARVNLVDFENLLRK